MSIISVIQESYHFGLFIYKFLFNNIHVCLNRQQLLSSHLCPIETTGLLCQCNFPRQCIFLFFHWNLKKKWRVEERRLNKCVSTTLELKYSENHFQPHLENQSEVEYWGIHLNNPGSSLHHHDFAKRELTGFFPGCLRHLGFLQASVWAQLWLLQRSKSLLLIWDHGCE